jgi:TetR/AcrR family transcriptional repressor of nem operon
MSEGVEQSARVDRRRDILDTAERLARLGGYNGFSFRDIAAEVGVKSASVHYHFPTKRDLVAALVDRYTERFVERLGPPGEPGALLGLIAAYREALGGGDGMCLCGLLAAESGLLPEGVREEVRRFFDRVIGWASAGLGEAGGERTGGETLVAGLEGALVAARAMDDPALFDRAAARLLDAAKGQPWRSESA